MAPKPVPAGGGKKLLGLNKWAWAGVAVLGVLVYVYFRHQSNTKAAAVSNAPAPDASPIDTAALGGTPPPDSGGFDIGFLEALLDQQTASLEDFYSNYADMVGAGVYAGSGGPGGTTQAGAVSGGASADGASSASASSTQTTDVANTATFASDVFNPAPAPAPGESVATLSRGRCANHSRHPRYRAESRSGYVRYFVRHCRAWRRGGWRVCSAVRVRDYNPVPSRD
jgi:hypothetical protein